MTAEHGSSRKDEDIEARRDSHRDGAASYISGGKFLLFPVIVFSRCKVT